MDIKEIDVHCIRSVERRPYTKWKLSLNVWKTNSCRTCTSRTKIRSSKFTVVKDEGSKNRLPGVHRARTVFGSKSLTSASDGWAVEWGKIVNLNFTCQLSIQKVLFSSSSTVDKTSGVCYIWLYIKWTWRMFDYVWLIHRISVFLDGNFIEETPRRFTAWRAFLKNRSLLMTSPWSLQVAFCFYLTSFWKRLFWINIQSPDNTIVYQMDSFWRELVSVCRLHSSLFIYHRSTTQKRRLLIPFLNTPTSFWILFALK